MRILRRLALLGTFAAVGVGIALGVVFSTGPLPFSTGPFSHREAAQSPGPPTAEASSTLAVSSHPPQTDVRPEVAAGPGRLKSDSPPPVITIPAGPVVVEPHPARTYQVHADVPESRVLKLLEDLKDRLTSDSGAAPFPPAVPAQRPAAASPAPPPAVDTLPPSLPSKKEITRSTSGEGDGNLRMQFQNNDIREVLEALSEAGNLNILAGPSVQGKVSATLNAVDIDSALDAIL